LTLAQRAAADLRKLVDLWPALTQMRLPDAHRPYMRPVITPERRAELDHQARAERLERDASAPGEHPDAVRPEILDLMSSVLVDATDLADRVAVAVHATCLPPPSSGFADARPYLRMAGAWTASLEEDLLHHVADVARDMLAQVSRTLGLVYDGQQLEVVCPWCSGGVTGAATWRVRTLPGDLVAIVCESGVCEPPSRDVGTWWRGAPAWPMWDWEFLAKRVDGAERMSACG
jgi:hypothetical protein